MHHLLFRRTLHSSPQSLTRNLPSTFHSRNVHSRNFLAQPQQQQQQQQRTMASTSQQPLQEWLVIVPDYKEALSKRLAVRPKHLEGIKGDREDFWLWGGAMLEEPIQPGDTNPPKMKGSACLIGAATRDEVVERLKKDVYVQEGVWNWDEVQIIPFKSTVRKAS